MKVYQHRVVWLIAAGWLALGCNAILGNSERKPSQAAANQRTDAGDDPEGGRRADPDDAGPGATQPVAGKAANDGGRTAPGAAGRTASAGNGGARAPVAGRGGSGAGGTSGGAAGTAGARPVAGTGSSAAGSGGRAGAPVAGTAGARAGSGAGTGAAGTTAPLTFCEMPQNDGMPCEDGRYCTAGDVCKNKVCTSGAARVCAASTDPCKVSECSDAAASCMAKPVANGQACGNGRTCQNGTCTCPGGQTTETSCNDGKDNDCDGKADCADPDCNAKQCAAGGTTRCCSGACVNIATDPNHCGSCERTCAKPPATQEVVGDSPGCVYIQFCTPNTVCRAESGCAVNDANANECRTDANTVCSGGNPPFWFCDRASSNCRLLQAP